MLALVLAVLYFGLIQLLMLDSARELSEARRFRARIVAETLAENAVELAARDIVTETNTNANAKDWQGSMEGRMAKAGSGQFDIVADGTSGGITESHARVLVRGQVTGTQVSVRYTTHTY
ncbi:MAG: hypothetical protein ABI779_08960 [Acidobacteriota bacterium]